ncbi:AAA domain-containing protein [Humibacillus xanthopallidus]|uniref:AAA domain-containing protein n=1 Tax=Humibacillus xanthopallidus TaxID=412689 RepID=A0A543PVN3_9MICO|nr:AAA family ATPase [Humibacillus xanthopallidus]TQN48144.1 AAA domain-containing protein [Humibacillus xanthopallidus]
MWHQLTAPARRSDVEAVVTLAAAAEPRCGATVVVAIDGPSGSGKTTLAKGVADALEALGTVEVVHMDLILPGWDGLAEAPGLLTTQVLEPLAHGRPAAYRLWSWVRDEWQGTRAVAPSRFLVVEGCGCSVEPAGAYAAVRVFVEADRALRMERGIARDGEAYRPNWERWAAQETELYAADGTRGRADLVVDTSSL